MSAQIIEAIREALAEVTERPVAAVTPEMRLDQDFDLDSYMFVQLLLTLEDKIEHLRFEPDVIGQAAFNVIANLTEYISGQTEPPRVAAHA